MATSSELLKIVGQETINQLAVSKEYGKQVGENYAKQEAVVGEMAGILRQVATDMSTIAQQTGTAQLQVENANRAIAIAAGVDPTTGAGTLLDLVAQYKSTAQDVIAAAAKRRKQLETTIFNDPIGFFAQIPERVQTLQELEGTLGHAKAVGDTLTGLNQGLQTTFQTTEKLKQSTTAATIEAASRNAASEARLKSLQAALEGLKFNTQGIEFAYKMSTDTMASLYNLQNATRLEEQLQLALREFDARREERAEVATIRKEGKEADAVTLGFINVSRRARGVPEIDAREAASTIQMFKAGTSKEFLFDYNKGREIVANGGKLVPIASNPADALEITTILPHNLPAERAEVQKLLAEVEREFNLQSTDEAKKAALSQSKTPKQDYINKRVRDLMQQQSNSIVSGSGNLLDVGDLGSFLGNELGSGIASLAALPLAQKVLLPVVQAKQPLDHNTLVGLAAESVLRGTVTSSEAVSGITEIFRRANEVNQAARAFTYFAIVPPKAGKSYNAKFKDGTIVDLTNEVQVSRYLSQLLGKEYRRSYLRGIFGVDK